MDIINEKCTYKGKVMAEDMKGKIKRNQQTMNNDKKKKPFTKHNTKKID